MSPDDPRHGTNAGHVAGCREQCCGRAKLRYDKTRKLAVARGQAPTVPALGTRRRIRALQALGHSMTIIAEAGGLSARTIHNATGQDERVYRRTAEGVEVAYERLCMVVPAGAYAARQRRAAARKGWLPPLAWDDIDDPNERPSKGEATVAKTDIDEAVVLRVLTGDRLKMTKAERAEVVRRARAMGWSEERIHDVTGIAKATEKSRYGTGEAA